MLISNFDIMKKLSSQNINEKLLLLQNSSLQFAEFITGILISEKRDFKLSAGKIIESTIKGNLFTQLGREITDYRDKGLIKEDYFATQRNRATLLELLKFIDEEVPEEELFKAMKSIFFSGVSSQAGKDEEFLSYEFIQTAKMISGTEVLILKANFEIIRDESLMSGGKLNNTKRGTWSRMISKQMGYENMFSLVSKYEENLETLGLIAPRNIIEQFQDEFNPEGAKFRLTELGQSFCKFISNY